MEADASHVGGKEVKVYYTVVLVMLESNADGVCDYTLGIWTLFRQKWELKVFLEYYNVFQSNGVYSERNFQPSYKENLQVRGIENKWMW